MAISGPNRNDPVGSTITWRRRRIPPTNPQDMEQGASNNPVDMEDVAAGSRLALRRGDDETPPRGGIAPRRPMIPRRRRMGDSGPSADDLNQSVLDKLSRQRMEDESVSMPSPTRSTSSNSDRSGLYMSEAGSGGMKKGGAVHSDAAQDRKLIRSEFKRMEKSEPAGMKKGGLVKSGGGRGDGIASRGKTRGRYC